MTTYGMNPVAVKMTDATRNLMMVPGPSPEPSPPKRLL